MAHSAQEFIRALKAPSDPPHPDGLSKVDIARQAWDDTSLYVPNKEEAITDWILTRFLKDKDKDAEVTPLLDNRYWSLLNEVLISSVKPSKSTGSVRAMKTWLLPLLNRLPIAPIAISLLSLFSTHITSIRPIIPAAASKSFSILWPLAVPKFSPDTLLDCFGAVLRVVGTTGRESWNALDTSLRSGILHIGAFIVTSYQQSFLNATNKKKLSSAFLQNHVAAWLVCVDIDNAEEADLVSLSSAMFNAGIDTVFNLDTMHQMQDQKSENTLLDTLFNSFAEHSTGFLKILPRFFSSYIQITRKYKSALFGQGSNQAPYASAEHARAAAVRFYALCDGHLSNLPESHDLWRARLALLDIVKSEDIFSSNDDTAVTVLRHTGDCATQSLILAIKVNEYTQIDLSLSAITTITRIDYGLLSSALPTLLPSLLSLNKPSDVANTFLSQMIDYHARTRTVDVFVEFILEACADEHLHLPSGNYDAFYLVVSSSPLFGHEILARLARSVNGFLTPGQTAETAQSILRSLSHALDELHVRSNQLMVEGGEGPRKKRKKDRCSSASGGREPEVYAISFALLSKIAASVFASLPLQTLQEDLRRDTLSPIQEFYASSATVVKGAFKKIRSESNAEDWCWQIIATSILRLRHSLGTASQLQLGADADEKLVSRMFKISKIPHVLPELRVEIVRSLLNEATRGRCEPAAVLEEALRQIKPLQDANGTLRWSGHTYNLTDQQLPVAVLYLLLERWLPIFDASASSDQVNRLFLLMTALQARPSSDPHLEPTSLRARDIVHKVLHNAQFWELPKFRDIFLAHVNEQTRALDGLGVIESIERPKLLPIDVLSLVGTYGLLLYAPVEILSRASHSDLSRKALIADTLLGRSVVQGQELQLRLILREFSRRVFSYTSAIEHEALVEYLSFLMDCNTPPTNSDAALASTTLELIAVHLTTLLRTSIKGEDILLSHVLHSFSQSLTANTALEQSSITNLRQRSLVLLVDILEGDFKLADFGSTVIQSLRSLQDHLESVLLPQMMALQSEPLPLIISKQSLLDLWHRLLVLRRWLHMDGPILARFGRTLAAKAFASRIESQEVTDVCLVLISIMQAELQTGSDVDRVQSLGLIMAMYLVFCASGTTHARSTLEASMSKFFKRITLSDYSNMLDLVYEGLSDESLPTGDTAHLVSLSGLIVHNAPEASMKLTQAHTTRSLNIFADHSRFTRETSLRIQVLESVSSQFNERPASIRQPDLSSTWSLLSSCLAGSTEHDSKTSASVYSKVVSIVSALIRMRRDLVSSTLPQLGIVIRRLILSLRHVRPHLGAKQRRMVTDSLPKWVNPDEPLSAEESKAVARLVTTLVTKTIVRTHSDTQKAESLARPFSKHAAYVLSAYIDALSDPLCFLPAVIRKELEPGLFALCDMMGEHNRDAMMAGTLDAGGKVVMKSLWREYEKQRYVGRG